MFKLLLALFLVPSLLLPYKAYSLDTSVRGFLALDALNYQKVHRQKGTSVIGIGVLDLKIYADQDDMSAAMKLDLDGKIGTDFNIFEEAYASYKGFKDTKIILGKGVVRFQNLHWGVIENTYQDGGTVIGSDNSFRKLARENFIAVAYGSKPKGFINQFTFWGESNEFTYTQEGKLDYFTTAKGGATNISGYKFNGVKGFNTSKQTGLANRLEVFVNDNLKLSTGQMYYKSEFQKKPTYGLDLGANYESSVMEIWVDALYGFTSRLPYDRYTTKAKNEYFLQVGGEYFLDEKWSALTNLEGLYIKDLAHKYETFTENGVTYTPTSDQLEMSDATVRSLTYKAEAGVKYKLSKSAQITFGGLYERKIASKNRVKNLTFIRGISNVNSEAFQLASSVSFWF